MESTAATQIFGVSLAAFFTGWLIAAFYIFVCYRITIKAGFASWKSFLMLIPGLNLLLILIFALLPWPIEKELREMRKVQEISANAANISPEKE
jgi:phosphotransferase system  glucose/maltose/N-acetylglucosamine-specific IIC component